MALDGYYHTPLSLKIQWIICLRRYYPIQFTKEKKDSLTTASQDIGNQIT